MRASVPLKIRVLDILHDCGGCTARQICDALYGKGPANRSSGISAHLRKMELDGLVVRAGKTNMDQLFGRPPTTDRLMWPQKCVTCFTPFLQQCKTGRIDAEIYGGLEEARKSAEDIEKRRPGAVVRIKSVEAKM